QLLTSIDPSSPALYITSGAQAEPQIKRRSFGSFIAILRKHIFDAKIERIWKAPLDRVIRIEFEKLTAGDNRVNTTLMLMLTGRSANAHLIDDQGLVIASSHERRGADETTFAERSTELFDPASLTADLSE